MPGTSTTTVTSASAATSISSWPTPTVSTIMKSNPAERKSCESAELVRASPPVAPRVAMERMKTPGSAWCRCMRTRSPRIAPPVARLDGSTAMMATVFPRRRISVMSASTRELFPAPGGPVIPTIRPLPSHCDVFVEQRSAVFYQRGESREFAGGHQSFNSCRAITRR